MTETPGARPRSAWKTFAGWHRTEQLWRDVYTRAVAGVVAVVVLYVLGAAVGILGTPSIQPFALFVGMTLVMVVVLAFLGRREHAPTRGRLLFLLVALLVFNALISAYGWFLGRSAR